MERLMDKQMPAERREAVVIGREHDGTLLWVREGGVVREAEELTRTELEHYEQASRDPSRAVDTWTTDALASMLLALPNIGATWDRAEQLGSNVEQAYWSGMRLLGLADPAECERAVRKLLEFGRPLLATELLGLYVRRDRLGLDPELIARTPETAAQDPGDDRPTMGSFDHSVAELLDALSQAGHIDDNRLASLEWAWLPLFRFGGRASQVLHRQLQRNPSFFVDLVSLRCRAKGEEPSDVDEQTRRQAEVAYDLLQHWRRSRASHRTAE